MEIWRKEVKIKGGMETEQLLSIMNAVGNICVGSYAKNMMKDSDFVVSTDTRIFNAACYTIGSLGFKKKPKKAKLWAKIKEMNGLCPPDLGPHLRYQFLDQQANDWALVIMDPISMSFTSRGIFMLGCSNGNGRNHKKLLIEGCTVGEDVPLSLKLKVIIVQ